MAINNSTGSDANVTLRCGKRKPSTLPADLLSKMKVSKTLRAIAAGLVCLMVMNTLAAEWQWSVPLGKVRAFVVGQNNMIEEGILQHDYFRKQMAKLGIAEIYIAPPFETFQNSTNNDTANAQFDAMLKSLAGQSGYGELEFAPILPIGHSAM